LGAGPSLGAGTTGAGCDGFDSCAGPPTGEDDEQPASNGKSKAKSESFMPS